MNAAMRKYLPIEEVGMSADERSHLEIQVAELRADVRHVQSDTTEIKAELRATTTEIKAELRASTTEIKTDLRATNQRIDSLSESVNKRIDDLKDSLASAKIWAFGLYVALAGSLFYVLARGFKWI
jgi:predicted  nucleic acid-binding Zn-ribbon protein